MGKDATGRTGSLSPLYDSRLKISTRVWTAVQFGIQKLDGFLAFDVVSARSCSTPPAALQTMPATVCAAPPPGMCLTSMLTLWCSGHGRENARKLRNPLCATYAALLAAYRTGRLVFIPF